MDIYLLCMLAGAFGLVVMAAAGLGRHGHAGGGHHGGHAGAHGGHAAAGRAHASGHAHGGAGVEAASWLLMSPRLLFAGLIGFGIAGTLLRHWIAGTVLIVAALAGAIVFERLFVAPLWSFALRFASNPALTLDSTLTADATAVTAFDQNGEGIVAVEVDGQVRQILASLMPDERARGAVVRAGQRVRIEEVDSARHRCRVTLA